MVCINLQKIIILIQGHREYDGFPASHNFYKNETFSVFLEISKENIENGKVSLLLRNFVCIVMVIGNMT